MFRPTARSIPVINNMHSLVQYLQTWRKNLGTVIQKPMAPTTPWNFSLTNKRGGFQLSWAVVPKADGYEILRSDTGDFSGSPGSNYIIIALGSGNQNSYFDAVGGAAVKKYYRVRATSGTVNAPHSVKGLPTGTLTATSIDASDTMTTPQTIYDGATSQKAQTAAGGPSIMGGTATGHGSGGTSYGGNSGKGTFFK